MSGSLEATVGDVGANRIVVAKKGVVGADLDGEHVMLDAAAGVYYGLNAVAATIWHYIQQPRSIAEVQSHVHSEFEVSLERCSPDVAGLVSDLVSRGLAEYVDEQPPAAP